MRDLDSQEGATAVLVSILLVVLFGASAIAVDLGSAYQTKRELVADTDAAALAAAGHLEGVPRVSHAGECAAAAGDTPTTGSSDTFVEADEVLQANRDANSPADPTYEMLDFDVTCGTGHNGTVTVAAGREATTVFAAALGLGATRPSGSSTAVYGDVVEASGLRPFSACYVPGSPPTGDPHAVAWAMAHAASGGDPTSDATYQALKGSGNPYPDYPFPGVATPTVDYPAVNAPNTYNSSAYGGYGVIHRVYFNAKPTHPHDPPPPQNACGTAAGNWNMLCFVGNCGDNDIRDYLADGYPGGVSLGGPGEGDEDCDPDTAANDDCDPKTGQFPGSSERSVLNALIAEQVEFPILLFNDISGSGSGAELDPSAFLGVVLRGYGPINNGGNFTGSAHERFLDLEFVTMTVEGRLGDAGAGGLGLRGYWLCDADGSPTDQC